MSLLKSIFALLLTLAIAWLCIINSQAVDIVWSPVHDPLSLPLYIAIIGGLLVGFLTGACLTWINGGATRKAKRAQKKQIKDLQKNLEKEIAAKTANTNQQKPPADFFPALPNKSAE